MAPSLSTRIVRLAAICLASAALARTPFATAAATDEPTSRIVMGSGGVPLVVQEWGNRGGIPVLLLHGFSFGSVAFKHQIGPITEHLHMVAPDLRGHGLSAKPWEPEAYAGTEVWAEDIRRVVEATGLENPIIVGWSFGGYVALNYLRHCDGKCASGLVLVGSLAGLVERPPPPDPAEAGLPPMKGDARADSYHELFENAEWLARVMTYGAPSEEEMLQKQLNIVMMPPHVRRAMGQALSLDNRDMPAQLTLPTLFVHGGMDMSVPGSKVAEAMAGLPDARSVRIDNAGHSPFAEYPEQFNALLLDFARSHGNRE